MLVLLLAVTLFGAATGMANAHTGHGESLAAVEQPAFEHVDPQGLTPEREDSAPRADEACKLRIRQSVVATATRIDAAFTRASHAGHWSGLADPSIVDSISLHSIAACSSHARTHASPRLQLKLQLGQAP